MELIPALILISLAAVILWTYPKIVLYILIGVIVISILVYSTPMLITLGTAGYYLIGLLGILVGAGLVLTGKLIRL